MSRKLINAAVAAVLLAPFAAISQDNAPAAAPAAADAAGGGTGTVVFFREKKMMGAAISYKVRENGIELCKLGSGSFCTLQVPVGKHVYVTQTGGQVCSTWKWSRARLTTCRPASRWESWRVTPTGPVGQGCLRRHEGQAQGQLRQGSRSTGSQGQEVDR